MAEKGIREIKKTAIQIGIGLFIAIVIIAARPFSFYKMIELKLLDQRFSIRGSIQMDPSIGTIDIDDYSLIREGRIQDWTRDKYARVIKILKDLDARMIGFDIYFIEKSAVNILRKEDFLKANVKNTDDILPLFRDTDEDLRSAMLYAENIVLGMVFKVSEKPDPVWVANNTVPVTEEDSVKQSAILALNPYNREYPEWTNGSLPMYVDIDPPLPKLIQAARGTGFAMTVPDIDGSIRHYPVVLVYDGRIWPSLALMMFLNYIGAEFKDVEIIPGKEIILPPGKLPDGRDIHVKIPINDEGLMMVNWAGNYWDKKFFHIPHSSIIENVNKWSEVKIARVVKKIFADNPEMVENIGELLEDPTPFIEKLSDNGVEFDETAMDVSLWIIMCKEIEDLYIFGGRPFPGNPPEYWENYLENINSYKNAYNELRINHKIAGSFAKYPRLSMEAVADTIDVHPIEKIRQGYIVLKNIFENGGPKPEDYPLYFDIPIVNDDIITEEDFKDRVLIYGLTAAGTQDLNPMPYNPRYPMVGLHANVLNNLVTQNFLDRVPFWVNILVLIGFGLLMGLLVPRFKPLRGAVLLLVILGGFLVTAQYLLFEGRGLWIDVFGPVLVIATGYTFITVYNFFFEEKEKKMIRGIFSRYVTKSVVDELIKNPDMVKLGGERKVLTVFFSDVAGFTTVSEQLTPEELVSLLNEYLTAMTEIILKYDGMLDKYEGDAIMAVFGTPILYEDHATRACYVSLEMQEELVKLRKKWKDEGRPELYVRIGLNTGAMVAGNMGAASRLDYTVMGDSVNLGSRLEGANKQYNTSIMISEYTYEAAKNDIEVRFLDSLRVKGKKLPVKVYELLGRKDNGIPETIENVKKLYEQGIEKYLSREWDAGLEFLNKALSIKPDDGPSSVYVKRCLAFKEHPPPDDWDGVFTMESK